jgi:DNA-binding MarR family transcriptional regulator
MTHDPAHPEHRNPYQKTDNAGHSTWHARRKNPPSNARETRKKRRGFFALDTHQFVRAGQVGLEPGAAYLALTAGTDESNTRSAWGLNAVANYTGMSRHDAKRAVAALEQAGLLRPLDGARTRARTVARYELSQRETRQRLSPKEQAALDAIRAGEAPEAQATYRARDKGWIERVDGEWVELKRVADCAFLPNSFVRTESGASPLARILNTGEINPLLLAVRLYQRQNLMEARGVPVEDVRQHYHAEVRHLGQAPYTFIQLHPGREWEGSQISASGVSGRFGLENEEFWPALSVLEGCHVVEWSVYTANGKPSGKYAVGRVAKPVGVVRNGNLRVAAPESRPGLLAYMIGMQQAGEFTSAEAATHIWSTNNLLMAVEHASVPHFEGVGILRMTHCADTENTKTWWRQVNEEARETFFFYEKVAEAVGFQAADFSWENAPPALAACDISM